MGIFLELRRLRLQLRFCRLSNRDVTRDLGGANDPAALVMDRRYGERDLNEASILSPPFGLIVLDTLAATDAVEDLHHLAGMARCRDDLYRLADDLGGAVAEERLGAGIPARDDPVQRLADDRGIRRLDDRRQQRRCHAVTLARIDRAAGGPMLAG